MIIKFSSTNLILLSHGPKLLNISNNLVMLLILLSLILLRRKFKILSTVTLKWKMRRLLIELFWLEFIRFKENKLNLLELSVLKKIRKVIKNFSWKSRVLLTQWRILNKMLYNSSWNMEKSVKDQKSKAQTTKNSKWSSPTLAQKMPQMPSKHSLILPSITPTNKKISTLSFTISTRNKTKSMYLDSRIILKLLSNKRLKYSVRFQKLVWLEPRLIMF